MTAELVQQAQYEFDTLPLVNRDQRFTIEDFIFAAQFEVDLYNEGDSGRGDFRQVSKCRRFVKKWTRIIAKAKGGQ